jgi:hypothetical protein
MVNVSDITWKEEHAKCRVSIERVPPGYEIKDSRNSAVDNSEYDYELKITEDLNDGRYHEAIEDTKEAIKMSDGMIKGRERRISLHVVRAKQFLLACV